MDVAYALIARREQIGLRLAMGLGVALTLGALIGKVTTAEWFGLWLILQALEYGLLTGLARPGAMPRKIQCAGGLVLIVLNNLVFGYIAFLALRTGEPWTIVCGMWTLAGALLNAGPSSRTSNVTFLATVAPLGLYAFAAPWLALRAGASPAELFSLILGASLLLAAALAVRNFSVQALRDAQQANTAKSIFLATMSHEIRTPLNGVLGMAQVMANDDLSEAQRERLSVIHSSGAALLTILNDVLDLSKIEAGKLELEELEFDLAEVANGVHSAFAALARDKALSFVLDIEQARGRYIGDPTRLRQILYNLISNALKFTERGEIRIMAARRGDDLEISVADTGVGIAPESRGKLFAKFDQLDSSVTRRFGGTGLGLAICRELATLMKGEISVESELGRGSTFTLRVPLRRIGEETPQSPAGQEPPPARSADAPLRVLAAEDNPVNQLVLKTLLEQVGVDPIVVENGLLAVEAWEAGDDWDVILMDIQMPVMDGLAAVARIRAQERSLGRSPTPIIALTADAMSHQVEQYLAAGMDGHVAKPIQAADLFETLARAAAASGKARAAA